MVMEELSPRDFLLAQAVYELDGVFQIEQDLAVADTKAHESRSDHFIAAAFLDDAVEIARNQRFKSVH